MTDTIYTTEMNDQGVLSVGESVFKKIKELDLGKLKLLSKTHTGLDWWKLFVDSEEDTYNMYVKDVVAQKYYIISVVFIGTVKKVIPPNQFSSFLKKQITDSANVGHNKSITEMIYDVEWERRLPADHPKASGFSDFLNSGEYVNNVVSLNRIIMKSKNDIIAEIADINNVDAANCKSTSATY